MEDPMQGKRANWKQSSSPKDLQSLGAADCIVVIKPLIESESGAALRLHQEDT